MAKKETEVKLVKMLHPSGDREADVHPDEVANYAEAGYKVIEK